MGILLWPGLMPAAGANGGPHARKQSASLLVVGGWGGGGGGGGDLPRRLEMKTSSAEVLTDAQK